ncbi:helix-turn-helix transcriptional regulator [[Brevibacterium] frigoritolerans]|uniref:Helix-turn-helix transcriptional regulator n=1 Tax=Peribacillus frigoritolerans TaxID=450367 RepID=A0A941JBP5_9BACI|nr:helix-turn-helix transcriptional regulator [Peribacillus frigoritolerans]
MFRFGKRKPRSKVGKLIDKHGYTQEEFVSASGISRNTISRVCSDQGMCRQPGFFKENHEGGSKYRCRRKGR